MTTDDRILHVAVDRAGRTWRLLEREDGTLRIYYSAADDPPGRERCVWDTADRWTDPPRVFLARAEARVKELERACHAALHTLRSYQYGNSATALAKGVADDIEAIIGRAGGESPTTDDIARVEVEVLTAQLAALRRTIILMRESGHELPASLMRETWEWDDPPPTHRRRLC